MRLINDALGTMIAFLVMAIIMYPKELYSDTIFTIIVSLMITLIINTLNIKRNEKQQKQIN